MSHVSSHFSSGEQGVKVKVKAVTAVQSCGHNHVLRPEMDPYQTDDQSRDKGGLVCPLSPKCHHQINREKGNYLGEQEEICLWLLGYFSGLTTV